MGCPCRTHINTHLGPMWVLYFLLAGYVSEHFHLYDRFIDSFDIIVIKKIETISHSVASTSRYTLRLYYGLK